MPKAIKKKIKQKNLSSEVEIKDRFSELQAGLQQKKKTVSIVGGVLLAAVLAAGGAGYYRYSQGQQAQTDEYQAYKIYHNLYQKTPMARQEQLRQALDLFKKAYAERKSPATLLYIANIQADLDQLDDALKTLDSFTREHAKATDLLPIAYHSIAAIQLQQNKPADALKTLQTMKQLPGDILKDQALIETARILDKQGKKEEALAAYREISEKFPASPYAVEAKTRLGDKKEAQKEPAK